MRRRIAVEKGTADIPVAGDIRDRDSFAMWSAPITLAPGHQLRGNRCMRCAATIGGLAARVVTVVVMTGSNCRCGQIPTVTLLRCADHGGLSSANLIDEAQVYADATHPEGGAECNG